MVLKTNITFKCTVCLYLPNFKRIECLEENP